VSVKSPLRKAFPESVCLSLTDTGDRLGGSQRYVLAVRVSSRVRLRGTWRVLGRRDDLGALEAERRLLAQWAGHEKV